MSGTHTKEGGAYTRSRPMLPMSATSSPHNHDTENNLVSPSTDDPDLVRLLGDDQQSEELSHKRPPSWRRLSSSILSRRSQRNVRLNRRIVGICSVCEKLIPKRRRRLRALVLLGLGVSLTLVLGCVFGILLLAFFANDVHRILKVWGKPGHVGDGLASWPTDFSRGINPIPCHSHNDYWRLVPLFSAIGAGCVSVEADVWLFEEQLYVGHSIASLTRNRTLNSLYIEPLLNILAKQNPTTPFNDGRFSLNGVFDTSPDQSLVLLIDFKTPGADLWPYVLSALQPLRERRYLTHADGDLIVQRPITVIGTGNTPFDLISSKVSNPHRDVFFDAPLQTMYEEKKNDERPRATQADDGVRHGATAVDDVPLLRSRSPKDRPGQADSQISPKNETTPDQGLANTSATVATDVYNVSNSYYASGSFNEIFGHLVDHHFSEKQMELLRGQIRGAHRRGLKARYWELPYWPIGLRNHVWEVLVREGVDLLNVDDLKGATERDWRRPHPWW